MNKNLLLFINDDLKILFEKGEVISNYYNPCNYFSHIHFVVVNCPNVDASIAKKFSGDASISIQHLNINLIWFSLLISLSEKWAQKRLDFKIEVSEDFLRTAIIRGYGVRLGSSCARFISEKIGLAPYYVSLHENPDADVSSKSRLKRFIKRTVLRAIEKYVLQGKVIALPVYRGIIPYMDYMGVTRYHVVYNSLNRNLVEKVFASSRPKNFHLVCVGRQDYAKDPRPIIKAVLKHRNVKLTVIGNGVLHESIHDLVSHYDSLGQIELIKAVPNDVLVQTYQNYDALILNSEMLELSKVVLEAFLVGIPVILNRRNGLQVPELNEKLVLFCEPTVQGFEKVIEKFVNLRLESVARQVGYAKDFLSNEIQPHLSEQKIIEIYEGRRS